MRFLVLIALCLAVASATYSNRNRFNRLLRNMRQPQHHQQGGLYNNNQYDLDELDQDQDDEDDINGQQQCRTQQCRRNQRYGSLNLDDDESEYDIDDQDEQGSYQGQHQGRQGRQQQKRHLQQRHQCQPKFQLLQALEQANAKLASKLYQQAKQENDDKNTVTSPAALQLALAAIQRGARGNTKRQIQALTGLNKQENTQAHAALQQSLQGQDPIQQQFGQRQQSQVKTTTTIIINQRNHAQQQFIQAVQACLNAQVKKCDFQRQHQQCRHQINRHVAQKTHNKLQQVLPQDAVTGNTKMVVVNTAQLKAKWGAQFRQQQTTKQGRFFPLGSQQPKPVQVLQSQGQFNYYEDEQLQVVGVPTQQQELTMFVIVPKDKDGLNQIEKVQIQDPQQLKQLLEQAEQQQEQVDIELPKFQIKHKIDAKQTLRKQGIQDVFDADECDLSGINGQQPHSQQSRRHQQYQDDLEQYPQQQQQQLHLNKLIQQATIKVDEQGISAANSRHQEQSQYQQNQYQNIQDDDDEQDQDQYNDEDEQEQQYRQQQYERQEMLEEIFGQRQNQHHQRRQHRQRRHQRNQYQGQFQGQYQGQYGEIKVKANRAFAFAIRHNPSKQIVMVGRVVDATQIPKSQQQGQGQQSLNGVDQQ